MMSMTTIKPDKWYRFEHNSDRIVFLWQVQHKYGCSHQGNSEIEKAECLKYNSKTNTINYRSTYNPQYCQCYEVYKSNVEVKKMDPICNEGVCYSHDPILENYFAEKRAELKKDYLAKRLQIIETSEVGKAAKAYIDAAIKACGTAPSIDTLVTDMMLPRIAQDMLEQLHNELNIADKALHTKYNEVKYLLEIADTFEQKMSIYERYGILVKETNIMKALKAKVTK